MKFGYARISTHEQNADMQIDQLLQAGCDEIFCDTASGTKAVRPALEQLLGKIRPGDVIIIWKLDRLGRSLRHLSELVNQLMEKSVGLKSLQDPVDTTNAQGRLVFNLFASLAEFERALIVERTQAALAAARARGRTSGRPQGLTDAAKRKAIAAEALYTRGGLSVNAIAENLGISKVTLYRYLKYRGMQVGRKG